jgi:hypothetical protein
MKNIALVGVLFVLALWFNCAKGKAIGNKNITHPSEPVSQSSGAIEDSLKNPYDTKCADGECSTFVFLKNGTRIFATEYSKEPSCRLVSQNLLKILMSCGSPCNYTLFVNLTSGAISIPFFMALAIDTLHEYVAFCDTSKIKIAAIFDSAKAPIAINRPFSQTATMSSVVDTAIFRNNGLFVFHYYAGKDFVGTWDSLEITF